MDVGGGRRRLSLDLFWCRIARRQQVVDAARQTEVVLLEELGDAEIEELHLALAGDEDVRRLEVAVDHQVRMRIGDRVAHLEEDRELGREGESGLRAEAVDRHPLDVLERQVRSAVRRDPAVDQTRDARMLEPRQDLALAFEPQAELARAHRRRQQLDRDALLEGTVGTLGEEDLAHSAGADRVQQTPWARSARRFLRSQVAPAALRAPPPPAGEGRPRVRARRRAPRGPPPGAPGRRRRTGARMRRAHSRAGRGLRPAGGRGARTARSRRVSRRRRPSRRAPAPDLAQLRGSAARRRRGAPVRAPAAGWRRSARRGRDRRCRSRLRRK